ncbi:MAG: HtaA domain-containing protein [Microbacterium sp.]
MTGGGELRWAVKDSFLHYVRDIAAGTTRLSDGARQEDDGTFSWPLVSATRADDQLRLVFGGSVRFTAHGGFLDVDLRDPRLVLTDHSGSLSIAGEGAVERVVIASVDPAPGTDAADALIPLLTAAGAELFGGVYTVATAFAPLVARIPLHS